MQKLKENLHQVHKNNYFTLKIMVESQSRCILAFYTGYQIIFTWIIALSKT